MAHVPVLVQCMYEKLNSYIQRSALGNMDTSNTRAALQYQELYLICTGDEDSLLHLQKETVRMSHDFLLFAQILNWLN